MATSRRADYGSAARTSRGGLIASVAEGSPAARAGLAEGDTIMAVDASTLRDVLDWQWHTADADAVALSVRPAAAPDSAAAATDAAELPLRDVTIEREPGESWGVEFAGALFDGVRTCRNDCAFCFMSQLPRGLRPALYLRDDDYRLSFMQGNFVTLTNLDDADVTRVAEQSLSPLYVSLHAVSPEVRAQLVSARDDRALERIDTLLDEGIDFHMQIVLVPGANDGDELDHTLTWLAQREGIVSVGIVPLGFTSHQERFGGSFDTPEAARVVVAQVREWQEAFRAQHGVTWVQLADEFYITAEEPLPPAEEYDGFPQYENGIGIARSFLDDVADLRSELAEAAARLTRPVTVVTGRLGERVIAPALEAAGLLGEPDTGFGARIDVLPIENAFFGGNVGVAGLLTSADIVAALETAPADAVYLLPDAIVNSDGLTLDGVLASELRERTGREVRLVSSDAAGLLEGLSAVVASERKDS